MIKCGFAETVITPRLGLNIPGYFDERPASSIKDDLFAKAFVVDDCINIIAFVTLDILFVTSELVRNIRNRVCFYTGIPEHNIMVSGTHSHTGSPTSGDCIKYIGFRAADAVILAYRKRENALLGCGKCSEYSVSFNRRYLMKNDKYKTNPGVLNPNIVKSAGVIDPDVTVIRVDKPDGSPLGIVVNFACHLDVVSGTEYSSDYAGEISKVIKKVLGEDVVVVFMTGCCGDINHVDVTGTYPTGEPYRYLQIGRILAGDVISVREKIKVNGELNVDVLSKNIKIGRRQPTAEQIEWSRKVISGEDETDNVNLKEPNNDADVEFIAAANTHVVDLSYAVDLIEIYEHPKYEADVEIQSFRIGDIGISTLPGEIFTDIGLNIKSASPFKNTLIVELANGCHGYIGTQKAHDQISYEVKLSAYTYLEPNAEFSITDTAVAQLKNLKNQIR